MSKHLDIAFSQLSNILVAITCALACGCPFPVAVISALFDLAHSSGAANGRCRTFSNSVELARERRHG